MRVVLDTNVIISAAISKEGKPAKIFEMLMLQKIENVTSDDIIAEITAVLHRPKIKKYLNASGCEFIIKTFVDYSHIIQPTVSFQEIKDDPDDDKFLECAVTANVNYIISGDPHLLTLKEFLALKLFHLLSLLILLAILKIGLICLSRVGT